jgi:peptidoglycan/LPS O-acetylase OafA/YrhL
LILTELERGEFSFLRFYERRIKRIFPALIVVLIASFGLGWVFLLAGEFQQFGKHTIGAAGFVSNLLLWEESGYFDFAAGTIGGRVSWCAQRASLSACDCTRRVRLLPVPTPGSAGGT